MKTASQDIAKRYQRALIAYMRRKDRGSPRSARGFAACAQQAGVKTLDIARLHEETLVTLVLPAHPRRSHPRLIARAGTYFALAMTPVDPGLGDADGVIVQLKRNLELLSRRTVALASANLALSLEITQRKTAEQTLKQSERQYATLLERSDRLQEQLRHMSRKILSAQEDERRHISRELHDVIAQTLSGINVRLDSLKKEATIDSGRMDRSIDRTQRLVVKAVEIVHRFACDLRPAVLDDLGLIPALQTFVKPLAKRAGFHVEMKLTAEVELLSMSQRTVLFRVAQEALSNVARHADATQVAIMLKRDPDHMEMRIHDDGKSFDATKKMAARGTRLGLLGMRERIEMIGGTFAVTSAPGNGTTISARIPLREPGRRPQPKHSTRKEPRP